MSSRMEVLTKINRITQLLMALLLIVDMLSELLAMVRDHTTLLMESLKRQS